MTRLRSLLLLTLALLGTTAGTCVVRTPTPTTPPTFAITVHVAKPDGSPLEGSTVRIDGQRPTSEWVGSTGSVRFAGFVSAAFNVCASAPDYREACAPVVNPTPSEQRIDLTLAAMPRPPPPAFSTAGEHGALHVTGMAFLRDDGTPYQWRGFSDFGLFQRYLAGEDVTPQLDQRIKVGATLLRVFGMYDTGIGNVVLGPLRPADHGDYYQKLGSFADLLATRGLRFEFVVLADAQIVLPSQSAQRTHGTQVAAALNGKWNATIEVCNEPFKNGCLDGLMTLVPPGLLRATGQYDLETGQAHLDHLEYVTDHTERKPEWPRTARALAELRDGFGWGEGLPDYAGVHVPVVGDEPTGFAEIARGDSRSASPEDARWYGALAGLMSAGATFHSDAGIASTLMGPVQEAAAKEFFAALRWVPIGAQFSGYQRGSQWGGPGIGDMPLQHFDSQDTPGHDGDGALRTFCKIADGFEWCDAVRPGPTWTARPLRGCAVKAEPARGLVQLQCP